MRTGVHGTEDARAERKKGAAVHLMRAMPVG